MDTLKIREIMEYSFRRGSNAAHAARNVNDLNDTMKQQTYPLLFLTLLIWTFCFDNNNKLDTKMKADDNQPTAELEAGFKDTNQNNVSLCLHFHIYQNFNFPIKKQFSSKFKVFLPTPSLSINLI